jgi:hypothetical protein
LRFDAFLLANAAVSERGKLYIHGGGITQILAPVLPWTHPQIALVVRIAISHDELSVPMEITIKITDPKGETTLPPHEIQLSPPPMPKSFPEGYIDLTATFSPVTFWTDGQHSISAKVGDLERTLPFMVVEDASSFEAADGADRVRET